MTACSIEGLDLFEDPHVQVVVERSSLVEIKPPSALNGGPIRIHREADFDTFVDLSQSMLR